MLFWCYKAKDNSETNSKLLPLHNIFQPYVLWANANMKQLPLNTFIKLFYRYNKMKITIAQMQCKERQKSLRDIAMLVSFFVVH